MSGTAGGAPALGRRSASWGSLQLALALLATTAAVVCGAETALLFDSPGQPWVNFLFPIVAGIYVCAGLIAWERRPSNRLGALLYACSLPLLVAGLESLSTIPALALTGMVVAVVPIAAVFHVLLAFPSGRVGGRLARTLVAFGYFVCVVLQAPRYLFSRNPSPYDAFEVAHRPGLVHAGTLVQNISGAVVLGAGALLLAVRLRRATSAQRRVLGPLYLYGICAILFLETAANALPPLFGTTPNTVFALQMAALAGAPVVFATAVLRGGFARSGAIEELGVWLGTSEAARPGLQDAAAATLGDPSVRLLFWLGESGYVDGAGVPAELPTAGADRAAVEVELAGERIGAIAYDAGLIAEPELVRAVGRVIALALERERLTAQLLASRDALRESRARIVQASDQERRRIARDLHDGLQGRLVALAVNAGRIVSDPAALDTPARAEALRAGILDAAAELRGLVHGVMPALLIERGLCAATVDLVDRLPVPTRLKLADLDGRLPEPVQSAGYFILAEALTNAVKHSRARELAVRAWHDDGRLRIEVADNGVGGATLGSGSGLTGLVDRLDALGGQLRIDSPPGQGTLVAAELPCG